MATYRGCEIETTTRSSILVIDDDPVFRHLLDAVLSGSGYNVDLAENCRRGFQQLMVKKYDLITLDVNIPEMDGLNFYTKIREELPGFEKRVLFVTGNSSNETLLFFTQNDCKHISKPFKMPDLLFQIGVILKKKGDGYAG
ncbi:MAG: response regulator [Deltaproteobacteria bacterium]